MPQNTVGRNFILSEFWASQFLFFFIGAPCIAAPIQLTCSISPVPALPAPQPHIARSFHIWKRQKNHFYFWPASKFVENIHPFWPLCTTSLFSPGAVLAQGPWLSLPWSKPPSAVPAMLLFPGYHLATQLCDEGWKKEQHVQILCLM